MARKLSVAIIGAGRVGQSLGRALRAVGYPISAVIARHLARARRARKFIGAGKATADFSSVREAQILLIATPDSAIPEVARQLGQTLGKHLRGRIALHTSGALTSVVLRPLAARGARVGSLHPLQTFSQAAGTAFRGVTFAVEGHGTAQAQAARMAKDLGGTPVKMPPGQKVLYHAAATLACGRLLALVDAATRMFVRAGLRRAQARRAVLCLVRQTLENFERRGGRQAWTGPLERRDLATLGLHARALKRLPPEYSQVYCLLGELALRLYNPRDRNLVRKFRSLFAR